MEDNACKYPIILVHGMFGWGEEEGINDYLPYWGANSCNIVEHYREKNYKIYAASVGPASSAWDRACELYAALTGGIVDYGKVHSEKSNHRRYGRFYDKPILNDVKNRKKFHLVGHSFGGNTIRLLGHLLTYGDETEKNGTPEEELSELFKGGHEDMIASITTICAPHNGTTTFLAAEKFHILPILKAIVYNYVGIAGRSPAEGTVFDFHLEQYGLSDTPGKKDAFPFRRAKKQFKHNQDNIEFDMCPSGAKKLNDYMEISPDIYYFSYSYNSVTLNVTGAVHVPSKTDFPFLTGTSTLILLYNKLFRPAGDYRFEDYCNDGLVDLPSALHPKDEPFRQYKIGDKIEPGIWNVMKTRDGDHGSPIGLFTTDDKTFMLYDEIFGLLAEVEKKRKRKTKINK